MLILAAVMIASEVPLSVWNVLNQNLFFVKNAVRPMEAKSADKFDIYDPNRRQLAFECREPDLGKVTRFRRLAGGKYDKGAPFNYVATLPDYAQQLFRVCRRAPFLALTRQPIEFFDEQDVQLVSTKEKMIAMHRTFRLLVPQKGLLFELKVKSGLNRHTLLLNNAEVAEITKTWKGPQTTYFEDGFDYALSLADTLPPDDTTRQIVIAFSIALRRILN